MSFRLRLTVLAAVAVAVAVVGTSLVVYYTDRHELISQVDGDLESTLDLPPLAAPSSAAVSGSSGGSGEAVVSGPSVVGKAVVPGSSSGSGKAASVGVPALQSGAKQTGARQIRAWMFKVVLPRSSAVVQVSVTRRAAGASSASGPRFSTMTVKHVPMRVLTVTSAGRVVTISRSLLDVDDNLSQLKWLLVVISLGGVGAAAVLGALVSGRAVRPLRRLIETTERIVETGDLSQRTGRRGRDEISRLSTRLDELLAGLEASLRTQRQLVADASHELRTPIATLRANVGLLARPGVLEAREREELVEDVEEELESMTTLVAELIELARGEEPDAAATAFRLDELVGAAVDRAARRAPDLSFRATLVPSVVTGVPERVERAVANLLDNARKWSPPGEAVEVTVHDGLVEVRDRGPGIAAEDRPLVFDRFYRAKAARGMPGAGLGLSIVKQIADAHGARVTVDQAPGGGAILRLQLSPTR